jgi:cytochrome c
MKLSLHSIRPGACARPALALLWACALASLSWSVQANPAENDAAMLKLATYSGCMACHSIGPLPRRADGLPPIAPAWSEVAIKYRDDPAASDKLTRTVMSGSDPKSRHWTGKVSPADMPPNARVVEADDARRLVNWILVLVP